MTNQLEDKRDEDPYRDLLLKLQVAKVRFPALAKIILGDDSAKNVNALRNYARGRSNRADIRVSIYGNLNSILQLTEARAVHKLIAEMKSEDDTPTYANQLRQHYGAELKDLEDAGADLAGTYIGYRHDPHTAMVRKSTLEVRPFDQLNKQVAYRHTRHDSDVYFVEGSIIPTKNTYCFFGQTRQNKDGKAHGGVATIFINRPTERDRTLWVEQGQELLQGLMMICLPGETYPAFATRLLLLKQEMEQAPRAFWTEWPEPKDMECAIEEIDGAMNNPSIGPDESIARSLISNKVVGPQDCLKSYLDPVP